MVLGRKAETPVAPQRQAVLLDVGIGAFQRTLVCRKPEFRLACGNHARRYALMHFHRFLPPARMPSHGVYSEHDAYQCASQGTRRGRSRRPRQQPSAGEYFFGFPRMLYNHPISGCYPEKRGAFRDIRLTGMRATDCARTVNRKSV